MRGWRGTEGFTLVEVLVALAILGVLLGAAYGLLFSGLLSWRAGEEKADLQQNARVALSLISREVRAARAVANISTQKGGYTYRLDEHNLFLKRPDGSYAWYYLEGGKIRVATKAAGQIQFGGHNEIAYDVQALTFSYDGSPPENSRVVGVTIMAADAGGRTYTLQSKARLRLRP